MELEFSLQIFQKYSDIKFHETPTRWSRVVSYGWTDGQINGQKEGETDRNMTKLVVTSRNFAKASKMASHIRRMRFLKEGVSWSIYSEYGSSEKVNSSVL
jgi:hypothetical protein